MRLPGVVLLVEDDDRVRSIIRRSLVRRARPRRQIDLLLSDLVIPGGTGMAIAEDLR